MEERLQKYMARCGIASRRKCESIITDGKVSVNGKIVYSLGSKIDPNKDKVTVNGKVIKPEDTKKYIMLNKPEGYVTTNSDEKGRKTVLDLIDVNERIYPIGRLDYDSSGLLLLTNDGDIYNKIIHPRVKLNKKYIVKVKGIFTTDEIKHFESGVDIGGYITADAKINTIRKFKDSSEVCVIIHEGKNRQIRKMCSKLGHDVIALKRVAIGNLKLGNLEKGKWRELSLEELNYINSL